MLSQHAISARTGCQQAMLCAAPFQFTQTFENSLRAQHRQPHPAIRRSSKACLDVAGPALTDSLSAEVCGQNTAGEHAVAAALGGRAGTIQVARPDGGTGARQGQITAAPEFASVGGG